ncbi:MAG: rRNA maturation RNase YbeY [Rhodospirillales bacterium]|nr:rRNA maturation RNase YbeY [Rhodospirillales bacterium]
MSDIKFPSFDVLISDPAWRKALPGLDSLTDAVIGAVFSTISLPDILGGKTLETGILLSDDQQVQALNSEFRGMDKPTNVLSFAALDDPDLESALAASPHFVLGDVIFAFETVEREAREQNKSFADHYAHLLTHGLLHLLGYDHIEDKEAEEMEALEVRILDGLGIENPYCED